MSGIIEKWNAFCEWQRRPPQLIKKSDEPHHCYTCGEEYHGNYCPQCGQSARIGRYSFKNALLLIIRTRANIQSLDCLHCFSFHCFIDLKYLGFR